MKRLLFSISFLFFAAMAVPFAAQSEESDSDLRYENSNSVVQNSGAVGKALVELTGRTIQADGVRGEYLTFKMKDPKMYPGTERIIKVYIPKEYKGSEPACVAIMMDDIMYGLAQSIDTLITSGQMPVTIAIGVRPGRIYDNCSDTSVEQSTSMNNKPAGEQSREVIRYNRSNEFDRCDGRFAAFLAEEVLPAVSSFTTGDDLPILLSSRAEDRMVLGASSGAIAAFTAAWFRPDLFSRVYSIIGTFVPMRGGDHYPGVIRKTEPQRLRIYLQDNDEDTWNPLFGSWYEYNLLMESALRFAGYELEHHWDKGGHNGKNGGAVMTEALRFLWKDYPSPVKKGKTGNATLNSIVDSSSVWTLVASNVPEGLFIKSAGESSTNAAGKAMCGLSGSAEGQLASGGKVLVGPASNFLNEGAKNDSDRNKISGLHLEGSGYAVPQLLGAGEENFNPYVAEYPGGKHRAVASVSSQWVSNEVIARVSCDGSGSDASYTARTGSCAVSVSGHVAGSGSNFAVRVPENTNNSADAGTGLYRQEFYKLHTNGGQICFDTNGYLYCATEIGVQICDHNGRVRVILPAPGGAVVTSVGFVGNTLYIIAGGSLYARPCLRCGFGNAIDVAAPDSDGQG